MRKGRDFGVSGFLEGERTRRKQGRMCAYPLFWLLPLLSSSSFFFFFEK